MREALRKLGLADGWTEPAREEVEVRTPPPPPPADGSVAYAAALLLAEGERQAAARLERARGVASRAAREEWLRRTVAVVGAVTATDVRAAVTALYGPPRDLASGGITRWVVEADEVLAALRGGWAATRAASALREARQVEEEAVASRLREEAAAAAAAAAAKAKAAKAPAVVAEVAAAWETDPSRGEELWATARREYPEEVLHLHSAALYATGRPHGFAALPPQGIEALTVAALGAYAGDTHVPPRALTVAAAEELRRRGVPPGTVMAVLDERWGGGHTLRVWDGVRVQDADAPPDLPEVGAVLRLTPHRDGWLSQAFSRLAWRPPRVFAALDRANRAAGGTCDVRHAVHRWGRHESQGWGRFLATAWKRIVVVPADEVVSRQLDDLAYLYREARELLRPEHYRLRARGVRTDTGWRLCAGAGAPGAVLVLESQRSSNGRHAPTGAVVLPAEGSAAPAAAGSGCSNGGGQHRGAVIAWLEEGAPLLLDDGSGVCLEEGELWRVPGLGRGYAAEARLMVPPR